MAETCPTNSQTLEDDRLNRRMDRIGHKIVVLSGKGGVGKSTFAVNLAVSLSLSGRRVGLMDTDIHGPSIPTMLGLEESSIGGSEGEMEPVEVAGIKVVSIGFFTRNMDDAVIWRGPLKAGVIRQFMSDVAWGDLDYLIIDSPPGTGDEPLTVLQSLGTVDGTVIVTTPQKVSAVDVRRSVTFCRQLGVDVLGIVENMSGFACPKCGEVTGIFSSGGGRSIADDMGVPFLGSIPMDPAVVEACDQGRPFVYHYSKTATASAMQDILDRLAGRAASDTAVSAGGIE